MIQFNLLPDVKLEYIKTRRTKRMVLLGAFLVAGISIALTISLFIGTSVLQRQHLSNLAADIQRDSKKLQDEPGLNEILTVQNQLKSLTHLHSQKPAAARLGSYLAQITPRDLFLDTLEVDFTDSTMTFEGSSNTLKEVNRFIDTLKFTTFTTKSEQHSGNAFTEVVLAAFARSDGEEGSQAENDPATYQITLKFNPAIFNNTEDITLQVPKTTTTRSATEKPDSLFQQSPNQEEQ